MKYYVQSNESAKMKKCIIYDHLYHIIIFVCQNLIILCVPNIPKNLIRKSKEKLTKIDIKVKRISLSTTANTASKKNGNKIVEYLIRP